MNLFKQLLGGKPKRSLTDDMEFARLPIDEMNAIMGGRPIGPASAAHLSDDPKTQQTPPNGYSPANTSF